jgi:hypothetical protein
MFRVLLLELGKGGQSHILRGSNGVGLLYNPMGKLKFSTLMLITSKWIMIETSNLT